MRRRYLRAGCLGMVVLGGVAMLGTYVAAQLAEQPAGLGIQTDGRLAPCPPTPNCVSSFSNDPLHAIAPIPFDGEGATARQRLVEVIEGYGRASIVNSREQYVHAVFRTAGFGFPDDVEFLLDPEARLIHVRSASRLGRGDLGVNRSRIERIRALLAS